MNHQNWDYATVTKRATGKEKQKQQSNDKLNNLVIKNQNSNIETVKKASGGGNQNIKYVVHDIAKIMNAEEYKVDTVPFTLSQTLAKARNAKKLTQKSLAQQIGVTEATIKSYENKTAIPNGNIISKLDTALDVKLPRK